jgi:hypothetical protein
MMSVVRAIIAEHRLGGGGVHVAPWICSQC